MPREHDPSSDTGSVAATGAQDHAQVGGAAPFLGEFARAAALTILPVLLFAIAVVAVLGAQERASVLGDLERRANAAAADLDRIFERQITLLTTLGASHSLDAGDLARFYGEAQRAFQAQHDWLTIILSAADSGQQLVNLLRPLGAPLPVFPDLVSHAQVVRGGKPLIVSNAHLRGPLTNRPVFGVRVPVLRDGRVIFVLSAALKPESLEQALMQLDLPAGWVGSVIDTTGITIACSRCVDDGGARPAPPAVRERVAAGQPGLMITANEKDIQSHIALGRAPLSGWMVGVSVSVADVTAVWQRKLWIVGLAGLISVAAALAAIAWITRDRRAVRQLLESRVRARTAALRESEERYARLANATREAVAIHDIGHIVEANASFARMFGYAPQEVMGKAPGEFIAPEAGEQSVARVQAGHEEPYESVGLRKDGSTFPVEFCGTTIEHDGRSMRAWLARDLTAQKKAEERLRELQSELLHVSRLSDMGQMAAALAHELTQPLTAVASYIHGCRLLLASSEVDAARMGKARDVMNRANEQALHAGRIIHGLRDFVAKRESARRVENAAQVIQEASALALVGAERRGIRAHFSVESSPLVLVDRIQIQQVLVNLVRNAVEAMELTARKDLEVRVAEARGMVEMSVSDTGAGLAPEIAGRLFAPFASTKRQGLGIGLSVCRAIVEAHGGRIWAEPKAGGGTTFRFTLPTVHEEDRQAG